MKRDKENLSIKLDDLLDSIDDFEDRLISEKLTWSASISTKNTLHNLKNAAHRYKYENNFGEHEALVNAFMEKQPITRDIENYTNSSFGLLVDAFLIYLVDVAELLLKPISFVLRTAIRMLSKKHNTSRTVIAEKVRLDSEGVACAVVSNHLPSNSDRQYIYLKHPCKNQYEPFTSPEVVLVFHNGASRALEPVFWSYRVIAYNADQLNRIEKVLIKGVENDEFKIMWIDTLNAKR